MSITAEAATQSSIVDDFATAHFSLSRLLLSSGHLTLFSLSVPRLFFLTTLFFYSWGTTLTILFSCPAFWYFSQLFYVFSQFSRFFGAPDSFFSSCAPFILSHDSLFLFLGHHTHNSLLMPRFLVFFSTFLCFLTIFSVVRGTWLFFLFLCPVYSFSLLSFSIPGAPHSQFSSHAPPHAKPQHSS